MKGSLEVIGRPGSPFQLPAIYQAMHIVVGNDLIQDKYISSTYSFSVQDCMREGTFLIKKEPCQSLGPVYFIWRIALIVMMCSSSTSQGQTSLIDNFTQLGQL